MNSRVHPNFKTKYRLTNWAEYDRALVQRGDITLWVTPAAIQVWTPRSSGRRGAPRKYSDVAIEAALTLRAVFRLPLRQAEGFLRSLLDLMDLMDLTIEVPDRTTLSRRSKGMDIDVGLANTKKGVHLTIDSTGLSIVGEGEWRAAKHGGRGKRGWRKLHLGVDRRGHILAQVLTHSSGDDAKIGLEIIEKTKGKLSSVTGDSAYDTVAIYQKAATRGARVVVPPTRSASISRRTPRSTERDKTIRRVSKVAGGGRKSRATIGMGRWRTRSSETSRCSAAVFTHGVWLRKG